MTSPAGSPLTPAEQTAASSAHRRTTGEFSRRTLVLSALVLFGALAIGIGAIAIFSDPGPPTPRVPGEQVQPRAIERPNQGQAPQSPGDRGGWEQLAILGLIIVAVAGIGIVIARGGGSKAKANRERWKAAAASGQDGAVDP